MADGVRSRTRRRSPGEVERAGVEPAGEPGSLKSPHAKPAGMVAPSAGAGLISAAKACPARAAAEGNRRPLAAAAVGVGQVDDLAAQLG
jgi:hypothetical protein